jgi:hypothetical protein
VDFFLGTGGAAATGESGEAALPLCATRFAS